MRALLLGLGMTLPLSAQSLDWSGLLAQAWRNSSQAAQIRAGEESFALQQLAKRLDWWPQLTLPASGLASVVRSADESLLFGIQPSIALKQKLPGGGSLNLSLAHQWERLADPERHRQTPSASGEVRQPLGPGLGGWNDPSSLLDDLAEVRHRWEAEKSLHEAVQAALEVVRSAQMAAAELRVERARDRVLTTQLEAADRRRDQGSESLRQLWKVQRERTTQQRGVTSAEAQLASAETDWRIVFGTEPVPVDLEDLRTLSAGLPSTCRDPGWEARLLVLEAQRLRAVSDLEAQGRSPVLIVSARARPDAAAHPFRSNWEESWSSVVAPPRPWQISAGVGISYPFDPVPSSARQAVLASQLDANRKLQQEHAERALRVRNHRARQLLALELLADDLLQQQVRMASLVQSIETLVIRGEVPLVDLEQTLVEQAQVELERVRLLWEQIFLRLDLIRLSGNPWAAELLAKAATIAQDGGHE